MARKPATISDQATLKATGKTMPQWLELLSGLGAADLPHKGIAAKLARDYAVPGWWAQGITVEFERFIGRRQIGQSSAGDFQTAASKTVTLTLDEALAAWRKLTEGKDEFAGVALAGEPGVSKTAKWRYWRAKLADGSNIGVVIGGTTTGKSTVAVSHEHLADASAARRWKAYWARFLTGLD